MNPSYCMNGKLPMRHQKGDFQQLREGGGPKLDAIDRHLGKRKDIRTGVDVDPSSPL